MTQDQEIERRGWGGAGRGQGMKPYYDGEIMGKYPTKLHVDMHAVLGNGDAAPRLRALLEWCSQHPDLVVDDPGPAHPEVSRRTSYTLTQAHVDMACALGGGVRIAGIRRAVQTAVALNLDLDNLPE